MTDAAAAVDWLCAPEAEVSAHYLVGGDGRLWQMVPEHLRAWHAGAGAWGAVTDVNSASIGIEIDNDGQAPFPEVQIAALIGLLRGVTRRWRIPPERVIGHSDMAPGRKIDPGPRFPWDRLAAVGVAVAVAADPAPGPVDGARFTADLRRAGYTAEAAPETLLAAFRLRHRPGADGPLDAADCGLAWTLARRYPVDAAPLLA